ncbi:hypothetical protein DPMN_007041 [Dreissena polymorpha]|uniref:Uncharacterized protein n=1 Tax=Dreissena polymorpha TaxID=45954 RepID=A0A9D4MWB6_DREPO|nr:hypothetical protein DPMN_007041 [Dreissena polymorpha]
MFVTGSTIQIPSDKKHHNSEQEGLKGPKKNDPPTGGHVFQATGTTFELVLNIIGANLLTKFHDDRTINMASRVLTSHVFPPTGTIFELIQDIIGTNHLTKFHDRAINVTTRVLTSHIKKNTPPPDIIRTNLLTKFHEDRKINVASRVLTRKNAPPPGSHVFQPTSIIFELVPRYYWGESSDQVSRRPDDKWKNAPPLCSHVFQAHVTIFELIQDIIETNLLTKFHEDWTINVASRVFTGKHAPHLGSHVFQANVTILELIKDIIETNLPIKFHEDWTINVASRVLTSKTAPPPGGHISMKPIFHDDWAKIVTSRVFTRNAAPPPGGNLHIDWASNVTSTVFTSITQFRGINGTNVLNKFHEDQTINVASRVFTRQNRSHKLTMSTLCSGELKNTTPPWRPYINGTDHLTKFHDDRTINMASRVLTRKNAPPPDITRTTLLTKFHEDRKINVASRVKNCLAPLRTYRTTNVASKVKHAPHLGSHVFQAKISFTSSDQIHEDWTINEASRVFTRFYYSYIKPYKENAPPLGSHTNLLIKFHEDWTINVASRVKTAPPPGDHVYINESNVLTKFHDDWAKIVTSRVFTRNTAPPPGGHLHEDWASNVTSTVFTSFEASRGIYGTIALTKFREGQTINEASRVFTRQNVDDARQTTDKRRSQKLTIEHVVLR